MATKVIGDYTAAITVDGTTNYLLIQPGDSSIAYNKINRSVLLGVSGQPVDISTSQTLSNKILGTSTTATFTDALFSLVDNLDTSKKAQFQLSGITTATTRTYTLPDASSTIADISTVQTLTNKTFTSPVINNGSITGTTITTDAIVGQSSATSGTVYGLSVSSSKVGTNGVITASITDAAVTPAKLIAGNGSSWTWQSFSPTWTNVTVGNGTVAAFYTIIGKTVNYNIKLTFGSTTAITGAPSVTFPVTASSHYSFSHTLGSVDALDLSATTYYSLIAIWATSTTLQLREQIASSTYLTHDAPSGTSPFIWATGDILSIDGTYEAA